MSLSDYEEWLNLFVSFTDKEDILDVSADDIVDFIEYISEHHQGTPFRLHRAEMAVRQFKKFYSARGHLMKDMKDYMNMLEQSGVGFVADVKRNRELVELRVKNPRKWSWRKLGEKFNIHYTTARQIFIRDRLKYAPKYDPFDGR